jgi:hypothetical protein
VLRWQRHIAEKSVEAVGGAHAAAGIDDQRVGHVRIEQVEGPLATAQDHGFGEDLGHPSLAGDNGGQTYVGVGGSPGLRVDQVVLSMTVGHPSPLDRGRCRHGTIRQADQDHGLSIARILDGDRPTATVGADACDSKITAEIHTGPSHSCDREFFHDEVGGQTLADATGVKASAGREADRLVREDDVGAAEPKWAYDGGAVGDDVVEVPVVTGAEHGTEHRRVKTASGYSPRFDCSGHEQASVGGHADRVPGMLVELAYFALGHKAAPTLLQLANPSDGLVDQVGRATHHHDVGVGTHRPKSALFHKCGIHVQEVVVVGVAAAAGAVPEAGFGP